MLDNLFQSIDELIDNRGWKNYALIAETEEYKLYHVYMDKLEVGCVGYPCLAIETNIGVRTCEGRENRLFYLKYQKECQAVNKMRKEKFGIC